MEKSYENSRLGTEAQLRAQALVWLFKRNSVLIIQQIWLILCIEKDNCAGFISVCVYMSVLNIPICLEFSRKLCISLG